MINTTHTVLLIAVAALITILLRIFPFLVFNGKREMPSKIRRVADLLPPAIMGVLVIYCFKDYILVLGNDTIAALIAVAFILVIHLWKKNTLLSIALGTAIYMILIRVM